MDAAARSLSCQLLAANDERLTAFVTAFLEDREAQSEIYNQLMVMPMDQMATLSPKLQGYAHTLMQLGINEVLQAVIVRDNEPPLPEFPE